MKKTWVLLMAGILFVALGLCPVPARGDGQIVFSYQCTNDHWWSGLVVTNGFGSLDNNLTVFVLDDAGVTRGSGTVTFRDPLEQRVGLISDFLEWGTVPPRGSIVIYSDGPFSAVEIIGNDTGGFGMNEKVSEP